MLENLRLVLDWFPNSPSLLPKGYPKIIVDEILHHLIRTWMFFFCFFVVLASLKITTTVPVPVSFAVVSTIDMARASSNFHLLFSSAWASASLSTISAEATFEVTFVTFFPMSQEHLGWAKRHQTWDDVPWPPHLWDGIFVAFFFRLDTSPMKHDIRSIISI